MYFTFTLVVVFLNLFATVKLQDNTNDTILEFFNNCKCVAFYNCEKINEYLIAGKEGLLGSQPIECSQPYYQCCKTSENIETPPANDTETNTSTSTTTTTTTQTPVTLQPDTRKVPTNASCGVPRTFLNVRILNPETDSATTIPGEQPWLVEIFQKRRNQNTYRFKCAGTLIHPRVVMTALHNVKSTSEQELKVIATGQEVFQNIGTNPDNERNVVKIIKHPEYYSGGLYNDIALLVLKKEFKYSKYPINSICLPDSNQVFDAQRCLALGWGANPDHAIIPLKKVDVPVVNFQECQNLLRKPKGVDFNLHESFLCAGGEEGKDTCKGDGGSPLICLGDNYNYVQAGIVSWGVNCGVVNQPGVYTNVAHFKNWIVEELRTYDVKLE